MTEIRRVYKSEEKMKIVMEGLSGTIQISDLCKKYELGTSRFYKWKEKLLKNAGSVFDHRGRKSTADQRLIDEQKRENQRLKETIAEIITENPKKKIGNYGRKI
jgi:transposase-like protein